MHSNNEDYQENYLKLSEKRFNIGAERKEIIDNILGIELAKASFE